MIDTIETTPLSALLNGPGADRAAWASALDAALFQALYDGNYPPELLQDLPRLNGANDWRVGVWFMTLDLWLSHLDCSVLARLRNVAVLV